MTAPSATLDYLIVVSLLLVTLTATAAALTRDPVRQAAVLSALGLCLSLLFLFLQAPDVALSQLAVGGAITPLLVLLTVRKIRRTPHGETGGKTGAGNGGADTGSEGGGGGGGGQPGGGEGKSP
ncbi:hydrogenase subunit MbhD domain-containing protein [Streptomyces hoynatensis]|uniref:hydrogenase subunit MbhD domain-containing protein n=1 Tax=Streptomyces hoynatensis TaxID=1141874 RepID=UPI001F4E1585|nr:hydrogenase subunit MbhD domain-containing protein [Streptomyces hoynatensis]